MFLCNKTDKSELELYRRNIHKSWDVDERHIEINTKYKKNFNSIQFQDLSYKWV